MSPREAMLLAIEEARKGAGFVSPNPLVGCVILDKDSNLIGKGYHQKYGEAHAEINALNSIRDAASKLVGAHVYVTLEPCAHEGKTGSCAKKLAELPLGSVTFGLIDPFPKVSGKGAQILKDAGIAVEEFGDLKSEFEELAEIFLLNQRLGRPFISLKTAASLDGKIALEDGSSQWITGEKAREHTQYLRGCHDAVLVGAGTVLKDDPRLNSRYSSFERKPQRLVVLDPDGLVAAKLGELKLLSVRSAQELILVTKPGIKPAVASVSHITMDAGDRGFDLLALMAKLWARDIRSLFIEGGASTYSAFLQAGLVDRLYLFLAPKLLGQGMSWTNGLKISDLSKPINLTQGQFKPFGEDWLFTAKPSDSFT